MRLTENKAVPYLYFHSVEQFQILHVTDVYNQTSNKKTINNKSQYPKQHIVRPPLKP